MNHALTELKLIFSEDIRSRRTLDKINTTEELVKVLKKRDVYSERQMEIIESILSKHVSVNLRNRSRNLDLQPQSIICTENIYPSSSRIQCNIKLKAKIYETIASDIGRKWEEFGRYLYVPESELDRLRDRNNKDKVYIIFIHHENNCDPRKWKSKILKALRKCRRMDLYERVEHLFDTFICD